MTIRTEATEPTSSEKVVVDASQQKLTYRDCLLGKAPVPADAVGFFLFQLLMVGGMVTIMASFNGYRHSGLEFFLKSHWFYPLVVCIAFTVRRTIGNKLTGVIIPRFVNPHFTGMAGGFVKNAVNVCIMAPIMSFVVSLLLEGANFASFFLSSVLLTMGVAFLVNSFLVGPVVKMVYNNRIAAGGEGKVLLAMQGAARDFGAILGIN